MSYLPALRSVGAGAVASVTVAALAFQSPAAAADPGGRSVSELLRDLQVLYTRTEAASEAYRTTATKLSRQRERTQEAQKALASVRSALAESRRAAGRVARQQYRRGDIGLPPLAQLMLSRDPQGALDGLHLVERTAGLQALTVQRLVAGESRQRQLAGRARAALAKQQKLTDQQRRQRDEVRTRLREVEKILASLSGERLERMRGIGAAQQTGTPHTLTAASSKSGRSGRAKAGRLPSPAGARALAYALRQLGKPYRYGAAGPRAFDCSGLTSTAWRKAGRRIPRTSQGQWKNLRHVPMNKLRPGDLVVYYRSASHVALYAGLGKIVHAPRPGSAVKLAPVRSIRPVRGAVRPDPGQRALREYTLPKRLL